MANQDNVVSFENMARERARALSTRLVKDSRKIVADTIPKLIHSLFEKLDDGLFEQALYDQAGKSDNLDNLFFDTMREIRKRRDTLIKRYVQNVMRGYDEFWQLESDSLDQGSSFFDMDEDKLTLLEDQDLEEDLALKNVISVGFRKFSKEIFALNQRFAVMHDRKEVTDTENPIAPMAISKAFPHAISGLEVDLRIKLVIYKLFEREVVNYLGAMYDDINALLKNAGVLPKLPSQIKKNPVSPAIRRFSAASEQNENASVVEPGEADNASIELENKRNAELFNTLRGLIHSNRGPVPIQGHAQLPKVEMNDLLSALSSMQTSGAVTNLSLDDAVSTTTGLRDSLSLSLNMGAAGATTKAFAEMDEDTIDVISMLFEFILEDINLPDAMKALLSRLQIPMLKVAIIDRQFFSEKRHPARKLLNALARAAVGWVDDGDRSENSLYGKISSCVMQVLNEFREDVGLFQRLHDDFSTYVEREQQGAEIVAERITEVTKGREKLKLAQIRVADVVNSRVKAAGPLPEVVKGLLKDGWKDVLTLTFLRQGEDSEKWQHVVALVDKLLWSVQPKTEVSERQQLLKQIPELLKALRSELVEISYDQHKLGQILKGLQASHIKALKGIPAQQPAVVAETPADASTDNKMAGQPVPQVSDNGVDAESSSTTAGTITVAAVSAGDLLESPSPQVDEDSISYDEYYQQAKELKLGSWIEWTASDDARLRGKLSWKSTVTGTLVFVGRKGTKLAELSVRDVADLFRMKKAVLLEDAEQPLLERAMHAMVEALKKTEPA